MALGSIPPWLSVNPQDFVRAAQSGAATGLQISEMRQRAMERQQAMAEAAARRAQAQQEAAQRAWEFGENLRQRAELAAMENERQAQYQAGMLNWHREQMRMDAAKAAMGDQEAQTRLAETARHNLAMEAQAKVKGERSVMPTEWGRDPTKSYVTAGGAFISPEKTIMDPVQKALLGTETKRLQAIDKELFDLTGGVEPEVGYFGIGSGKKNQYDALINQRNSILNSIQAFGKTPMTALGGTNAPPQMGTLKTLDRQTAIDLLKQAGGDKEKARELARQLGYTF